MSYLHSLLLGIVQGITEFLPVSSSGHLIVMRHICGIKEIPLLYDILLHISTLIVVIIVFRHRIGSILLSILKWLRMSSRPDDKENLTLSLLIILVTGITAAIGLVFSRIEPSLIGNPRIISIFFFITALILILTRFFKGNRSYLQLGIFGAIIAGFAQGLGVLPGISRSGITISAALLCGLDREKAGEFSFLIAVPAILGALIVETKEAGALMSRVNPLVLGTGIAASFGVGLLSLIFLLKLVRKGRLYLFSAYLIPLSIVSFLIL